MRLEKVVRAKGFAFIVAIVVAVPLSLASVQAVHPLAGLPAGRAMLSSLGAAQAPVQDLLTHDWTAHPDAVRAFTDVAALGGVTIRARPAAPALGLGEGVLALYELYHVEPTEAQVGDLRASVAALDPSARDAGAILLSAVVASQQDVNTALSRLTPAEFAAMAACAPGRGNFGSEWCLGEEEHAISDKVDVRLMADSAASLLQTVQDVAPSLRLAAAGTGAVEFQDPLRLVQFGGRGPDHFTGNSAQLPGLDQRVQALTLDFGGNDLYTNTAGGALPVIDAGPYDWNFGIVSLTFDLGGDDRYVGPAGVQGAGNYGIGLLVDMQGNDFYDGGSDSQGMGFSGVGVLVDVQGDDIYAGTWDVQGAAYLGIGLLLDMIGNDTYLANNSAQGFDFDQGIVGALVDLAGNDWYDATCAGKCVSQGSDFRIGTAVFFDLTGDDFYHVSRGGRAFLPFGPYGLFPGLAIFIDGRGMDAYTGDALGGNGQHWEQYPGTLGLDLE